MYADNKMQPISDNQQYIAPDGTQFPWDFPKDNIPGLHRVTESDRPTDPSLVVTDFTINDSYVQVWHTRAKTAEELSAEDKQKALNALDDTDMVALRCFKAGVQFPDEWKQFVVSLRAIVNGGAGPVPTKPQYPQET